MSDLAFSETRSDRAQLCAVTGKQEGQYRGAGRAREPALGQVTPTSRGTVRTPDSRAQLQQAIIWEKNSFNINLGQKDTCRPKQQNQAENKQAKL